MGRFLVFAHHDDSGVLRDDTRRLIEAGKKYFSKIFVVSTNLLRSAESDIVRGEGEVVCLTRYNFGYDFYSYREGLLAATQGFSKFEFDRVYLLNSSCLVLDPDRFLTALVGHEVSGNPVFGMTRSYERELHIQSYSVSFPIALLKRENFLLWWRDMEPFNDRQSVIDTYEFGLSRLFAANGFALSSVFDQMSLGLGCGEPVNNQLKPFLNPTHFYWQELLQNYGFLKTELIDRNPYGIDIDSLYHAPEPLRSALVEYGFFKKI